MGTIKQSLLPRWIGFGNCIPAIFFIIANLQFSSASSEANNSRSMYYVCPPEFSRLGSSCYYFSPTMATWQDAHFACKDRDSNLSSPLRWEDRNVRKYLNRPEISPLERWIGGVYDYEARAWKWGGEMRKMNYQSFSRMRHLQPDSLRWHCVAMDPLIKYRWAPRSCVENKHFICQTKLRKVPKADRNRLRKKWNQNGNGQKPNEISAPDLRDYDALRKQVLINNDLNPNPQINYNLDPNVIQLDPHGSRGNNPDDYINNNVTPRPVMENPKSYEPGSLVRPDNTAFGHRPTPRRNGNRVNNRKKKPFRGYKWSKEDPEAAYLHNVNALKSGKTGLSNAQIEKHLQRLERLRKKEAANRKRKEKIREEQNRERNIINNEERDSALAARVSNKRSRTILEKRKQNKISNRIDPVKKSSHSIENVTQRTYVEDNHLSALHPKNIVEVHDFSSS